MFRTITIALLAHAILSLGATFAYAEFFTHYLDDAVAALEARRSPGPPRGRAQRAVVKALRLAAKPHDRLSQDLKTGAKICSLVAKGRPGDRQLFDIIEAGLVAMEAEVLVNVDRAMAVLDASNLSTNKRAKRSAKIQRFRRRAEATTDPAQRASRFAKVQRLLEKIFARHGT